MTDWKSRALAAEAKLTMAASELALYYMLQNHHQAIAAMQRLRTILGVELKRSPGVLESQTVAVEYVTLGGGS